MIISKDNNFIKKIVKLANNRNYRYQELSSTIYGEHLIKEALAAQILQLIIITNAGFKKYSDIIAKLKNSQILIVDEKLLAKINILDSMVDIIGLIDICEPIFNLDLYNTDCVLLESIQDPGNLGAILRSVAASGIKNVILSPNSIDVYNPKVLRASQGTQFKLNLYQNIDLNEFIRNYQGQLVATMPDAIKDLYALDYKKTTAWVFGNEGSGLSSQIVSQIPLQIKIPMPGMIESLNIATALTVCLFEMVRQRY